jgi:multimeric flavodoxin WrbA
MPRRKKVVILLGSPRRKGNSATLAAKAALGAKAAGADVTTHYLHGLTIKPCNACEACHKPGATGCVIPDDMRTVYPDLQKADAILFASPVYWFSVSAQMKLAFDRCYALLDAEKGTHFFKGKKIGVILTYGAPDVFSSGGVNALRMFQDAFQFIGAKIIGMVHGTAWAAGDVKKNRALLKEARDLGKSLAT